MGAMSRISRSPLVASPLAGAPDLGLPDPAPGGLAPEGPAPEPDFDDVPRRRLFPPVEYDADGYPCGDAEPMAYNYARLDQTLYAIWARRTRYWDRPDVFVTGDVFINYRQGDRAAAVAPDVCVAFGAGSAGAGLRTSCGRIRCRRS